MRPTIAADALRHTLTQYLTTTFGLVEESVRRGLEAFLAHPEQGIFRGPYLRIRTPFRPAGEGWRSSLEWAPDGFAPYLHQARAFQRLSTAPGPGPVRTRARYGGGRRAAPAATSHRRRSAEGGWARAVQP